MGQPSIYHATVALSFQIEICNLDRTNSSFLATSLYEKVIFTKNLVTRSCRPSDDMHLCIRSIQGNVLPVRRMIWALFWNILIQNGIKKQNKWFDNAVFDNFVLLLHHNQPFSPPSYVCVTQQWTLTACPYIITSKHWSLYQISHRHEHYKPLQTSFSLHGVCDGS